MASKICHETVRNPALLEKLLNEMQKQIEDTLAMMDTKNLGSKNDWADDFTYVTRTK
jgi:hypothetical protein